MRVASIVAGSLVVLLAFAASGCSQAPIAHVCSATDRQFLSVAEVNMTALGSWSDDYVHGDAKPMEVVDATQQMQLRLQSASPQDPTLRQTRSLMDAMLREYARAIQAQAHHRDAGRYMMRAYGLANFAHDMLSQAGPALASKGCDVNPLL